jgi:hypothetical protein
MKSHPKTINLQRLFFAVLCMLQVACFQRKGDDTILHTSQKKDSTINAISEIKSETDSYNYENLFELENYLINENIDSARLQEINESVVLLIYPTDEQIEGMKKAEGEDNFYTIADDAMYYHGSAIGLIDSLGVKIVTAERPFIKFRGDNQSWILHIRDEKDPPWNMIFFNASRKPEVVSTPDVNVDLIKSYFDR